MKCAREQRRAAVIYDRVIETRHRLRTDPAWQPHGSSGLVFQRASTARTFAVYAHEAAEAGRCAEAREYLTNAQGLLRAAHRFAKQDPESVNRDQYERRSERKRP